MKRTTSALVKSYVIMFKKFQELFDLEYRLELRVKQSLQKFLTFNARTFWASPYIDLLFLDRPWYQLLNCCSLRPSSGHLGPEGPEPKYQCCSIRLVASCLADTCHPDIGLQG
ncbi:hypothetical protein EVAR_27650_1 [Eumeta japonica]|uniref:Uncharacterized protein n=1 Tax=Eumeta variegata TaxID=151549 RepID=A0A4C1V1N1_EUMVA|nr:hypothetical protein EVAR_27650_1 [Eumeta japonica]